MGGGESRQGATGESCQESCPPEDCCQKGGGADGTAKGGEELHLGKDGESSGQEGCEQVGSGDSSTHSDGGISIDAGSRDVAGSDWASSWSRQRSCGRIISTMSLKSAALFALVGMILLTVVLAVGFIRDISAFTAGAIAAMEMLISLIHLLASLSVTVFLFVFYRAQS